MTSFITIEDDEYNYGVNDMNMAVNYVETSSGLVQLKDNETKNPLFVGINGGTLTKLSDKEIYSGYKRAFVMCMKNVFDLSDRLYKIYDPVISKDDLHFIGKQCTIIPTTLNVLRNNYYKKCGCVVEREYLTKMFGSGNYENTEIVIPLFELTQDVAEINVSLYDKQFGIENLKDILALTSYYNKSYKRPIIEQLSNHLMELREAQFWSQQRNCDINMTDVFASRSFNYKEMRDENIKMSILANIPAKNTDVEKVINSLIEGGKKDMDYLAFIDKPGTVFTDILTALQGSKKRTYYMTIDNSDLKIRKEDVTDLICSIDDEQELYYTFNTLLISKEYCHMVLNNPEILTKVQPLLQKYAPIYKLLIGYAWLCFVIEENIMKTKALKDHRFVFDINTANKLPTFPFVCDDLTQNPYLTVLVDSQFVNANENVMSLYCVDGFDGYGVCNLEQFKWRFNLFTSGNATKSIFDGIDWKYFAISGSVIPACLQKKSPLFDMVTISTQSEEDKWLTYFNHYYGESDIDMMCNDQSIFGFTTKADEVVEQIKKNLPDYKEGDVEIEPIKSMVMIVTKYFFEERLKHFNEEFNNNYTVDDMINQLGSNEMKEYLYLIYVENKYKRNTIIRKNKQDSNIYIKNFMSLSAINEMNIHLASYDNLKDSTNTLDSDTCFYINDFRSADNKVPDDKNYMIMKIGENVKFKIRSQKMKKSIELFRSKSSDFFGVVGRFHLPCVRAYYQGDNVYILPSCVTAMMTGINIDYKYFAGVRDPIDIINKYRMRGFGVLLTDKERKHMAYYNNNVKTFGGMFHIESNNKEAIRKSFGPRELSDKIYRPLVYTQQLPESSYVTPQLNYIKTVDDLKKYYQKKYGYNSEEFGFDLFKFKTITNSGSVMPYQRWIPRAYLEMKSLGNLPDHKQEKKPVSSASTTEKVQKIEKKATDEKVVKNKSAKKVAKPLKIVPLNTIASEKSKKGSKKELSDDEDEEVMPIQDINDTK